MSKRAISSACAVLLLGAGVVAASCDDTAATGGAGGTGSSTQSSGGVTVSTGGYTGTTQVFLIMMENHDWSAIKGNPKAPYMNGTLLTTAAHAEQYFNPPKLHPSEPNYIWLEAGDNLGITNDLGPIINHTAETNHLVSMIEKAGKTWRSYQEDIAGDVCPIEPVGKYAPRHNPAVFFDDVTDAQDPMSQHCIERMRPFSQLATDLEADTISDYNFITPNLCNDMHDTCAPQMDAIAQGDDWLAANIPPILASKAYARGAVVIVAWDEGLEPSDGPIPFFLLSKNAKAGFSSDTHYTHSSTVKTIQEILGLTPLLRHAGDADTKDFADLFTQFPSP
ncbi:MAG: alkaline phosphatase family protein [Polyangiaceae bacterium]